LLIEFEAWSAAQAAGDLEGGAVASTAPAKEENVDDQIGNSVNEAAISLGEVSLTSIQAAPESEPEIKTAPPEDSNSDVVQIPLEATAAQASPEVSVSNLVPFVNDSAGVETPTENAGKDLDEASQTAGPLSNGDDSEI
jgi:hypothetical protein